MSRRGLARHAAKRDANEPLIVQALEAQGFHVARISGKGIPDLLVSKRGGFLRLAEVKNPLGRNRETSDQAKFRGAYQGPPIITLRTVDDALRFMVLAMEHGK
jgi:Holliday junction resolvase